MPCDLCSNRVRRNSFQPLDLRVITESLAKLKPMARVLGLVLNGVVEDSRVLKCAYSAAEAGWDSLIIGSTRDGSQDQFKVGNARVIRIPIKAPVGTGLLAKVLRKGRYLYQRIKFRLGVLKPAVPGLSRAIRIASPYALSFKPDVIHAHDYTALPVAWALVQELEAKVGYRPKLIYDAHEFLQGTQHLSPLAHQAFSQAELNIAQHIDALLVVSPQMGPMMRDYLKLKFEPVVVANDPISQGRRESARNLRTDAGAPADASLLVYSGAVAPQRGVGTVVSAIKELPNVFLVVIAQPGNVHVQNLLQQASSLGIHDRVKTVPYVPNAELVHYLSSADVGLIPLHHRPNHEISLITKFGEYAAARLPILVSDVKTMAAEVRSVGNGEVFIAEDVADCRMAIVRLLSDLEKYRSVYTPEVLANRSWERQAESLIACYNAISSQGIVKAVDAQPFSLSAPEKLSGPDAVNR